MNVAKLGIIEDLAPCVEALEVMPSNLWHLWVVYVLEKLREHTTKGEYEEFLKRFSFILAQRVETGVW